MAAFRRILVHVDDDVLATEALHLAAAVAAPSGASIDALLTLEPMLQGAFMSPETAAMGQQLMQDRHARQRQQAQACVAEVQRDRDCSIALHVAEEEAAESLQAWGRTRDLLVISQRSPSGAAGLSAPQAARALLGSGCPVLIVPHIGWGRSALAAMPLQCVLVAWSDTRESARALRDALPFLAAAQRVELVQLAGPGADENAEAQASLGRAAAHLACHGIQAATTVLNQGEPSLGERMRRGWVPDVSVAESLLSHSADIDAGLIVMGAYGHSRLWEYVLGGVTKTMLESMTVPVLMSH